MGGVLLISGDNQNAVSLKRMCVLVSELNSLAHVSRRQRILLITFTCRWNLRKERGKF